jgi:hypothetical protein
MEIGCMKGSVLARPNLKLFVLAAILLLAVQDLLSRGHSQSTVVHARLRTKERVSDQTLHTWLVEASQTTTPDVYMRISDEYYRRGEIKRALFFMRRAEQISDMDN